MNIDDYQKIASNNMPIIIFQTERYLNLGGLELIYIQT